MFFSHRFTVMAQATRAMSNIGRSGTATSLMSNTGEVTTWQPTSFRLDNDSSDEGECGQQDLHERPDVMCEGIVCYAVSCIKGILKNNMFWLRGDWTFVLKKTHVIMGIQLNRNFHKKRSSARILSARSPSSLLTRSLLSFQPCFIVCLQTEFPLLSQAGLPFLQGM